MRCLYWYTAAKHCMHSQKIVLFSTSSETPFIVKYPDYFIPFSRHFPGFSRTKAFFWDFPAWKFLVLNSGVSRSFQRVCTNPGLTSLSKDYRTFRDAGKRDFCNDALNNHNTHVAVVLQPVCCFQTLCRENLWDRHYSPLLRRSWLKWSVNLAGSTAGPQPTAERLCAISQREHWQPNKSNVTRNYSDSKRVHNCKQRKNNY